MFLQSKCLLFENTHKQKYYRYLQNRETHRQENELWLQRGRMWEGIVRSLDVCTTVLFKYNQQGPTIEHMELCSMLYGSLDRRGVWGVWIHMVGMA